MHTGVKSPVSALDVVMFCNIVCHCDSLVVTHQFGLRADEKLGLVCLFNSVAQCFNNPPHRSRLSKLGLKERKTCLLAPWVTQKSIRNAINNY